MTTTTSTATTPGPDVDPVDLSSLEFWGRPMAERDASFAELRSERPISWHRPPEGMLMPGEDDPGFWAVVRHEDIGYVSKNPKLFCSGQGVQFQDAPEELLEASQSFLAMDAPRHTKLRKIVSAAFTPKQVRRVEDRIAARARSIVDELLDHGDGDFVAARGQAAADGHDLRPHGHARGVPGVAGRGGRPARRHERPGRAPEPGPRGPAAGGGPGAHGPARPGARARRGPAQRPAGRPHDQPRAGRGGRREPHRQRDRRLLRAALGGRQRHHAQHDRPHHAPADRAPGPARVARRGPTRAGRRRRWRSSSGTPARW